MTAEVAALFVSLALGLAAAPAAAAKPRAHTLTLFTIGKSQNKNQVQYAVHVDGQCVPASAAPVFAYWRMLELGPNRVEPLLPRELSAYGPASQLVTTRGAEGGKVRLVLRALHDRPIVVETRRAVKLTWHLSVDYLLVRGWSMDGTRVLSEKLRM